MRRFTAMITAVVFGAVVFGAVVPVTISGASPPSGDLSYTDYARGTVGKAVNLDFPAGTVVSSSTYTVAPGRATGWRTHPGPVTLVVTAGELALSQASGCSTEKYAAGQAAVVPAGQYLVANPGGAPLTFIGVFAGLAAGTPKPLVTGDPDPAPAACAGLAAAAPAVPSVADLGDGRFVDADGYYGHPPAGFDSVVEAGKDVFVTTYRLGPGASAGWHTHPDVIGVMLKGTFSYYEGHHGKCVPSGRFSKGQAWFVKSHEGHGHLGVNEEDEPLEVLAIYFNVPDRFKAVPVLGNQMDVLDFSPMPPADCPRLRDKNL